MANIIGNNPDQWAKNQVNLRQQLLGLENKTPEMLAWQTSKTAWIRAISAVQVDAKTAKDLTGRQNFGGGKLAQEYVLFNGTIGLGQDTDKDGNTTYNQTTNLNSGVYAGQQPNNSAYGFEYETSRGLVPMPGIEDLSVTTYNRGSLRKASFKMKAYNVKQFAALDALFMRPGYTILLEWGHTNYFKGTPEAPIYTRANFNTLPFLMMNDFLDGNKKGSQQRLLAAIKKERGNGESGDGTTIDEDAGKVKGSQGNYDGFYGKITNFVWNLNSDGSYSIEVKAISTGDIIESLTIDRVEAAIESKPKTISNSSRSNTSKSNNDDDYVFNLTDKNDNPFSFRVKNGHEIYYREYWYGPNSPLSGQGTGELSGLTKDIAIYNRVKNTTKVLKNSIKPPPNTLVPEDPGPQVLIASKDKSKLNAFLYKNYNYLKQNFKSKSKTIVTSSSSKKTIKVFNTLGEIDDYGDLLMLQPTILREVQDHTGATIGGTLKAARNSPYQYIKLERLLEFIEEELLIYNGGLDTAESEVVKKELAKLTTQKEKDDFLNSKNLTSDFNEKILSFDLDGENFMYTQPTQFSADPNVCLIPFKFPTAKVDKKEEKGADGKTIKTEKITVGGFVSYYSDVLEGCNFKVPESDYVANMLNIPVNLHYIGRVLKQTTSNNAVPLLKFLEQLLYGINTALGSINKFSVTYDHDLNTVVFRDDTPLDPLVAKGTRVPPIQRTLFNVNGWKPLQQNASFIHSVGISTTLSNKFATMISIGAQSQKSNDIADAGAFSRWNTGLNDSVTPSKLSKAGINSKKSSQNKPFEIFSKSIVSLNKPTALIPSFYQSGRMPDGDVQETAQSLNANLNRYITTIEDKELAFKPDTKPNSPINPPSSQGFIPFNMNLDMDGFSGLRIYEKFYITTEILPPSYPKTLSFICKGMTHTINNNGWKTKIDSLTVTSVDNDNDLNTPDNTYNYKGVIE